MEVILEQEETPPRSFPNSNRSDWGSSGKGAVWWWADKVTAEAASDWSDELLRFCRNTRAVTQATVFKSVRDFFSQLDN